MLFVSFANCCAVATHNAKVAMDVSVDMGARRMADPLDCSSSFLIGTIASYVNLL